MAGRPKILITEHLDVSRTSILLNASGQVVHPSQAKPHYVPAEPYKAATSKMRHDDVRPVPSRLADESALSSTGSSGCSSGVTPPQLSSCDLPASPSQTDSLDARTKPVNVVDPFISNSDVARGHVDRLNSSTRDVESQLHYTPGDSGTPAVRSPAASGSGGVTAVAPPGEHEHTEPDDFASRYERQLQINAELKRLLLASLGSDLQSRLEQLNADKAALSCTVGEFSRRLVEDHEDLDRLTIQADMWRSKFLATKLMADALAQEKAALAQQCTVMASALQDLLDERRLIHSALRATSRYLQRTAARSDARQLAQSGRRSRAVCGGRGAVEGEPSASHMSCTSRSLAEEILDSVETLAESSSVASVDEKEVVFPSLTSAELKAYKVLHGPRVLPPRDVDSRSAELSSSTPAAPQAPVSTSSVLPRFHKFARYDGAMYFGCRKCTGELVVL